MHNLELWPVLLFSVLNIVFLCVVNFLFGKIFILRAYFLSGVKTPLSPTVRGSPRRPFSFGSSIQLMESSLYSSSSCVMHSCSSDSLGDIQYDSTGSFWSSPRRSQMRLQSRRSQSREDLSSSLADSHMLKM